MITHKQLPNTVTDIVSCAGLDGRIIFLADNMAFCCHNADLRPLVPIEGSPSQSISAFLYTRETIINELNSNAPANLAVPCFGCRLLRKRRQSFEKYRINQVYLSRYNGLCNARCIYCAARGGHESNELFPAAGFADKIASIVAELKNERILSKEAEFRFASGEITILPHKDIYMDMAQEYRSKFLTNAFIYNDKIAQSLACNESTVNVSLDAGTPETFERIKGFDMYNKVIDNLKMYRNHGNVSIKYNVLPGINDSDADFEGIIEVLQALRLYLLEVSADYYFPLKYSYYPTAKLSERLCKANIKLKHVNNASRWRLFQENFTSEYNGGKLDGSYELANNELRGIYANRYVDDYRGYVSYIAIRELERLITLFPLETSFALLGDLKCDRVENRKHIVQAFENLEHPLKSTQLPLEQSYDELRNSADVFLLPVTRLAGQIKSHIQSAGGDASVVLDIDEYLLSYEPARAFLEARGTLHA